MHVNNLLELVTSHFTNITDGNSNFKWNLAFSFLARIATSFPFSSEKSTIVKKTPFCARAKLRALPTFNHHSTNTLSSVKSP